ncbi:Cupredoxin [Cristinia sonorae]|uniref:Cupredoxin n=1 Tax=Cristinia sonorae TaxID=1940300 RepID=A0A8K0XUU2_9AGAR|nr:Cupredoxin [Cristinia sonorae]
MRFTSILAALPFIGAALAQTNHVVLVGANGTLTYSPSEITAAAGDTVSFQFLSKNHTVTQSTFTSPCSNMTNPDGSLGVDSGFQAVPAGATQFQQWTITVNNASAPMWFYCRQANHCAQGMVFAINPTAAKSFDAFQSAAKATGSNTTSGSPYGSPSGSSPSGSPSASPSSGSTTDSSAITVKAGSAAGLVLASMGLVMGLVM